MIYIGTYIGQRKLFNGRLLGYTIYLRYNSNHNKNYNHIGIVFFRAIFNILTRTRPYAHMRVTIIYCRLYIVESLGCSL